MKSILAIETPNSCVTCPLSHPCKYVNTYFVKEEIIIERLKKIMIGKQSKCAKKI